MKAGEEVTMRGAELYNKEQGEEPFYSIFPPQWQYPVQVHRDSSMPVTVTVAAATSQPRSAPLAAI